MIKRVILGMSIAAVIAVSLTVSAYAFHQPYMADLSDTVSQGPVLTTVSVTSSSTIPAHTFDLAGYAWSLTSSPTGTDLFAITTHHGVKDSTQRPNQWHAHNVDVVAEGTAAPAEFCIIDIQNNPFAKINVVGNTLTATLLTGSIGGGSPTTISAGVIPADIIVEPACPITLVGGASSGLRLGLDTV